MKRCITIIFFLYATVLSAQQVNNFIQKGNDAYRKGDFDVAVENYKNALRKAPDNNTARFNLAN
ncbi:MAG: tetratricopeptide repeat protein, partial [Parafilimonas sp.]